MWKLIRQHTQPLHSSIQPIITNGIAKITDEEIAEEFVQTYGKHTLTVDEETVINVSIKAQRYLADDDPLSILNHPFSMLEIERALDNTSISAYNPEEDIHPLMLKKVGQS